MLLLALLAFLQALAVAAVLTPLARRMGGRLGMIDAPNEARKIHAAPVPRSGGLALFAAFWGCLGLNLLLAGTVVPGLEWLPERVRTLAANTEMKYAQLGGIFLGGLMIFVLGAIDDARGLSPRLRLVVQILAVLPVLLTGTSLKLFLPDPVGWVLTVIWVVFLVNSFNFLDNMNGLTSGLAVIIAAVLALQSALAGEYYMLLLFGLLGGAAMGFWFFNFPRASIFLGDSGSTTIGYLFAVLTILCTWYDSGVPTHLPILMPAIVLGVPIFDTLSVMWIRWRSGRPLMEGDRNHFSHRLVDLGMTRTGAVLFIYGVALTVGLAAVALRPLDWRYGLVQTAMIALFFVGIYVMERVSRRRTGADSTETTPPPEDRSR